MIVQINHFTESVAITAASARLVNIVTAKEPVLLVQQVFRKMLKLVSQISNCTPFVKDKKLSKNSKLNSD